MKKLPLIGLLALLPCAAHADIIPTLTSISGGPGAYTWNYQAQLTEDSRAPSGPAPTATPVSHDTVTGSFFTIYDFNDYIIGTCTSPSGWTCSVQNVGYTPDAVNPVAPPDNAFAANLTFTYIEGPTLMGALEMSGFSAQSLSNISTLTSFSSRTEKSVGAVGTIIDNVGNTRAPTRLPEPTSMGLLGLALAGMAMRRRKSA
jgi:hypothetical protein